MKIDLPLSWGLGSTFSRWVVKTAELVDVAPHIEEATFALHRCINPHGHKQWRVTHVETGMGAGPAAATRRQAINCARSFLKTVSPNDFWRAVYKNSPDEALD